MIATAAFSMMSTVIMAIVGLGAGIAAVVFYRRTRARLADSYRASGEVVEVKERRERDGTVIVPVVRYQTVTGEERTFESRFGKSH